MNTTTKPTIIPEGVAESATANGERLLTRVARKALLERLARLRDGEIRLNDSAGSQRFGARTARCGLSVTLTVRDPAFYSLAAFGGTVGAGEAYIHGHWRCDDLTALVRIMVLNRSVMEDMESGLAARGTALLRRLLHWANRNSKSGSARNIAAHYDLGNDLYRLMLDDTMAYSCGIFLHEEATLHEASVAKFDAVCRKLALTPSDHLVEIGTGWGGLAIHAAEQYGCRVTTTTISREQHDYAQQKIAARGLSDRITLLFKDYRDLTGHYDKLVSIEMIEAVGAKYLETYFAKCSSLLKPTGAMLLQAITLQDQFYAQALKSVDYIQRFIFPGSFIPSVTAISTAVARVTDMKLFNMEDIGPHYATTLAHWRQNFRANLPHIRALGYDDTFIRMWEYYLCYCEGGFAERVLGDVMMLLVKPRNRCGTR